MHLFILFGILLSPVGVLAKSSCPLGMVLIDSFCIDQQETTNTEYQKNTGHGPYVGAKGYDKPNQPRIGLNWHEADAYCSKLGKRLPTKAEWLMAAAIDIKNCEQLSKKTAVYQTDRPDEVCSRSKNQYGLCDMIGNAWEWVSNWDESGKQKMMLGGSCHSCMADDIFDMRFFSIPKKPGIVTAGVRCVRDVAK